MATRNRPETASRLVKSVMAAEEAVNSKGLSLRVAGERFDIANSTVHNHTSGKSTRVGAGRPPVLTFDEEKSIVWSCQELAERGFGVDRRIVAKVVRDYLQSEDRETPFKDGVPGKKWWRGFLKRWPSLSERRPQHFPTNRALASTTELLNYVNYFSNLQVSDNRNCNNNRDI